MKDTVISARVKRREITIWLVCFAVANIVNWAAIIRYSTPWYEVFTQLGYVTVMSLLLYGLVMLLRMTWYVLRRISK